MPVAFIGLGSNLGDRRATIEAAVNRLQARPGIGAVVLSQLRQTEPVGGPSGQAAFLNAAARVETTLSPEELLATLLEVERELGRQRPVRWGPRTIDLDLLLYDDRVMQTPELTLPHPRLHERRFALEPLAELAGAHRHPELGRTIQQLLQDLYED